MTLEITTLGLWGSHLAFILPAVGSSLGSSIAALAALAWRHMVISPHTLGALLSAAVGGLVLVAAGAITGLWALGRHGPAPRP